MAAASKYNFLMAGTKPKNRKSLFPSFKKTRIKLYINNEADLYEKFSYPADSGETAGRTDFASEIDPAIIAYLEKKTAAVPVYSDFEIELHIRDAGKEKHRIAADAIKAYVIGQLAETEITLAKINRNSIMLILAGILPLAMQQMFTKVISRYFMSEFLLVMTWVFMWKAVELLFFGRPELAKKRSVLKKIYRADFVFDDPV